MMTSSSSVLFLVSCVEVFFAGVNDMHVFGHFFPVDTGEREE
jgi:hypothetical protein